MTNPGTQVSAAMQTLLPECEFAPLRSDSNRPASHLAYQFRSLAEQHATAKHGMWLFLTAEAMLFGGLICAYCVLRMTRLEIISYGSQRMDLWAGAINAILMICSSLTMALAVRIARTKYSRYATVLLLLTFFFGVEFLGIKAFESTRQYQSKQVWGAGFYEKPEWLTGVVIATPAVSFGTAPVAPAPASATEPDPQIPVSAIPPAAGAPRGLSTAANSPATPQSAASPLVHHSIDPERPAGAHLFYAFYYMTTGLHAIHLLLGLGVLLWLVRHTARREFGPKYSTPVELGGLYWHFLSVVSLLVFALYYLV